MTSHSYILILILIVFHKKIILFIGVGSITVESFVEKLEAMKNFSLSKLSSKKNSVDSE